MIAGVKQLQEKEQEGQKWPECIEQGETVFCPGGNVTALSGSVNPNVSGRKRLFVSFRNDADIRNISARLAAKPERNAFNNSIIGEY